MVRSHFIHDFPDGLADNLISHLRSVKTTSGLHMLMVDLTGEIGFDHFALITHEDLRLVRPGQVDIRAYPEAVADRIIGDGRYRRDPVMRGCIFADSAFLWSELPNLIVLDRRDRESLEFGLRHGLEEGVTIPAYRHGHCLGSCTFAGRVGSDRVQKRLALLQIVGTFAFQQARKLAGQPMPPSPRPRLNPRPRDCIVLVGRGCSNKEIARLLGLAPRTVAGYLRDAMRLFDAGDRTELVTAAVLDGEIDLYELRARRARLVGF